MISEGMRCFIWIVFIVYDLYVILDYEMNKEVHFDKSRKSHKKSRKASRNRRCSYYDDLIRGDMGSMYGDHH